MGFFWLLAGLAVVAVSAAAAMMRGTSVIIYEWEHALLYLDGRLKRVLAPGRHRIWLKGERRLVQRISARDQFFNSGPVDVLTADHFPARLAASVLYRITDPRTAIENPYYERLQKGVGHALVVLAAERSLETLIAEQGTLGEALAASLSPGVPELEVSSAFTAITLPPEVRKMMTEVERAKFEGQAALERARAEQAALRSMANAARLLKNNPELMNLRMLQAVSPTGKGATLVLGQAGLTLPAGES